MFQLRIGEKILQTFADFRDYSCSDSAWEKPAIAFCMQWLLGVTYFSLQTSGSTGVPKRIEINKNQMLASAKATQSFFETGPDIRMLNVLNVEYIGGKMNLVRAMVWDCPIMLVPPSNQPIDEAVYSFSPDFITVVPSQMETMLKERIKLNSFKQILIGGAPINEKLKEKIVKSGLPAWQTYGMTETVSHVALAKISASDLVYQALPKVEIGTSSEGTLWLKSGMSDNQKIQTNDLVKILGQSSFSWLGRADFVINSGGIKLHPDLLEKEIDPIFQSLFPSEKFFFWGEKDQFLGEKLVLFIESEEDSLKSDKLLAKLKASLPKYQIPKKVYFCENFDYSPSGKILRSKTASKNT